MGTAPAVRILLCADCAAAVEDLRCLLETAGFAACWHAEIPDSPQLAEYDLAVVQSGPCDHRAFQHCQRLRSSLAERWLPILWIGTERNPEVRAVGLECEVDACLSRPFGPEEFLAQVNSLVRWKRRHDGLVEKVAELRSVYQQLQNAHHVLDQNLQLSRRIHQRLLPRTLPGVPPARFAVRSHPCGRVGGDLYHIFRLGDDQAGFYLADVVGHGISASLLTLFLKLAVSVNEVSSSVDGLMAPHEVLQRFNQDLLDLAAADNPLVSMVYALFDRRGHSLSFARAGSPHPIYVPRIGEPRPCEVEGTLLGVFDTRFTTTRLRLRAGDKMLFHSDGLHGLASEARVPGKERLQTLVERHRTLPIEDFVERLFVELLESSPSDDLTLLGLEIGE